MRSSLPRIGSKALSVESLLLGAMCVLLITSTSSGLLHLWLNLTFVGLVESGLDSAKSSGLSCRSMNGKPGLGKLAFVQKALTTAPGNVRAVEGAVLSYICLNDWDDAAELLAKTRYIPEELPRLRLHSWSQALYGAVLAEQGRTGEAISQFRQSHLLPSLGNAVLRGYYRELTKHYLGYYEETDKVRYWEKYARSAYHSMSLDAGITPSSAPGRMKRNRLDCSRANLSSRHLYYAALLARSSGDEAGQELLCDAIELRPLWIGALYQLGSRSCWQQDNLDLTSLEGFREVLVQPRGAWHQLVGFVVDPVDLEIGPRVEVFFIWDGQPSWPACFRTGKWSSLSLGEFTVSRVVMRNLVDDGGFEWESATSDSSSVSSEALARPVAVDGRQFVQIDPPDTMESISALSRRIHAEDLMDQTLLFVSTDYRTLREGYAAIGIQSGSASGHYETHYLGTGLTSEAWTPRAGILRIPASTTEARLRLMNRKSRGDVYFDNALVVVLGSVPGD